MRRTQLTDDERQGSTTAGVMRRQRAEWDELADADALWAVLSSGSKKGHRWTPEEFLATGEGTVARVLETAAGLGRPAAHRRALDYGCGAGRLTAALASRFGEVVGLDVSPRMVDVARRLVGDRPGVSLRVVERPDLADFPDGAFDLVLTLIVLQHLPAKEQALQMVAELVRVTARGGVAVVQAPDRIPALYRLQPLRRAYALLRRTGVPARALILRTPLQPMRMTALPRLEVEAAVARAGGAVLLAEPDGAHGFTYYIAGSEPLAERTSTSTSRATRAA